MWEKIILALIQLVVPKLLESLIPSKKVPSVTTGMVKDFEAKVGVVEVKRVRNAIKRERKYAGVVEREK